MNLFFGESVLRTWLFLVLMALGAQAFSQENTAAALSQRYQTLLPQLLAKPLGVPAWVSSTEAGDEVHGEVYALIDQPFNRLLSELTSPDAWCRIALLHLNIKACSSEAASAAASTNAWLTFYGGGKAVEALGANYPLRFGFHGVDVYPTHLEVRLDAETGPLGTSDYRITVAAIPIAQGSFMRVGYAFRSSVISRLATQIYLSTLGRNKRGFTVTGTDADGQPEYIRGMRGLVERNAVRYTFAVQAHLECLALPAVQQSECASTRWFDLTEQYPLQLHEMERQEYLAAKQDALEAQRLHRRPPDVVAPQFRQIQAQ